MIDNPNLLKPCSKCGQFPKISTIEGDGVIREDKYKIRCCGYEGKFKHKYIAFKEWNEQNN